MNNHTQRPIDETQTFTPSQDLVAIDHIELEIEELEPKLAFSATPAGSTCSCSSKSED